MNYLFTSRTCGKCPMVTPIVDKLEKEGHKFTRVSIDTTDGMQTAEAHDVMSVPTLIINGKSLVGIVPEGVVRKLLDE